ncbi:carboxylesterase [Epithele typhae]|uniref:carboxylesterase n=1 Tax=Epithele typhae TaxID=378194 RepID=UPI0020083B9F|nr:carboxylesterase [Epithele typhae]KAH9941090.1 carboxylesterase [Epithele typhae]
MIAKILSNDPEPVVLHEGLGTIFTGVVHPVSTLEAPVHQYLGIKYASIPARFRQSTLCKLYPPQTDCSHYGPICPQPNYKTVEEELFNLKEDCLPDQRLTHSEFECLNLNITCPADANADSRLPVMLWIHGGGNRGSGSNWVYDAGPLVQKGIQFGKPVVVVSINFRLGLLGFAASPALLADNQAAGDEGVGNYGLRDQRRAMEWVHRFIGPFGGDPNNITLFGESTGAGDILCHLHSAANEKAPLFQRSIIQSLIVDLDVPTVHSAGWQLNRTLSTVRINSLEDMRQADPEKLVVLGESVRAINDGVFFKSSFTGSLVPEDYAAPADSETLPGHNEVGGQSHHLKVPSSIKAYRMRSRSRPRLPHPSQYHQPILIGDCGAESLLWSQPASRWGATGAVKRIRAICQSLNKASTLLRMYDISAATPADELADRILELINDARFAWPTELVASGLAATRGGQGVWRYVFDQEGPSRGVPHHAVDLMYLFDNVPLPELPTSSYDRNSEFREDGGYFSDDDNSLDSSPSSPASDSSGSDCSPKAPRDLSDPQTYTYDAEWALPVVDDWTYARVRAAIQERWLAFAYGEAPWRADRVFVFGPEGETGERSSKIFRARRRVGVWREALAPLGLAVVQKLGQELCNGPPAETRTSRW